MNYCKYNEIKKGVKYSYDVAAKNYHKLFAKELNEHEYDKLLLEQFANSLTKDSIIGDIGCGPSVQMGGYLYEKGYPIEGLDFSETCIENAKTIYPKMKFHIADMTNTNLSDEYFDGIISFYTLFHIPKEYQYEVFKEFHRILKPNGKLLIMNHKGKEKTIIKEIWDHKGLKLFLNFSMEKEIEQLLIKHQFRIDKLESKKAYYKYPKERIIAFATRVP